MKKLDTLITVFAIAACLYHLTYTQYLLQGPVQHMNTHLGLGLLLVFLSKLREVLAGERKTATKVWCVMLVLCAVFALVTTGYVQLQVDNLQERAYFNTKLDLVIGLMMIILVIEATRLSFGNFIPILTFLILIYPFIGRSLPGFLYATSMPIDQTISNLSVALGRGIYDKALSVSASYVFLWILFGSLLGTLGATGFFMQLGRLIVSRFRAGPGLMAIATSALVGSITGSPSANIAITGSFTIPLMKKTGFSPAQAGAIEAAASNGGQIMPPIMGICAFAMAGITGIPYMKIVVMAVIPSLLYFYCCGLYVVLQAEKMKITAAREKADTKKLFTTSYLFLGPLIIIMVLLIKGFSVMFVAFWAIATVIALSLISKATRPSLRALIEGFTRGATTGAQIAAICACVGIIVSTFTMTGLGVKMSVGIEAWSGGHLFLALLIISFVCIIMGLGGVSLSAYIIVAIFAAPPLMKMGVTLEQAHFFVMFVSVFAFLTPPVALAALIASKIAKGSYVKTAVESVKVAFAAFLLPIMVIYSPVILLQPQAPLEAVTSVIAILFSLTALQFGFVGYLWNECTRHERGLWLLAAAALIFYLVLRSYALFATGLGISIFLTFLQWKKRVPEAGESLMVEKNISR